MELACNLCGELDPTTEFDPELCTNVCAECRKDLYEDLEGASHGDEE